MKKLLSILSGLAFAVTLFCSCGGGSGSKSDPEAAKNAYLQGRTAATELLQQCTTQGEIRDRLLELRARRYDYQMASGDGAAQSFEDGIRDYLKESGDTLYRTLFE